jgi:putative hydrolase
MTQEPFGDIPLFRELQRLLTGNQGPFNTEIARQFALSLATQGVAEPGVDTTIKTRYATSIESSYRMLSGYTRQITDEPPIGDVISRTAWVDKTLDGWGWLVEAFSSRFQAMAQQRAGDADEARSIEAAMAQIVPLMMGIQVGSLIGNLAKEAMYRYELPVPRTGDDRLFIVESNLRTTAEDYCLALDDLIGWIALSDTGRHLILSANPWVSNYFRSALSELISSIEIDVSDLERKMMELQSGAFEGLQDAETPGLPVIQTPRHSAALDRLRAFFSVFEGYAGHASSAVAHEIIPSATRIEEGLARRALASSEGQQALETVLGISLDRTITTAGLTFCAAVVKMRGIATLNLVWDAPDNLPTLAEIRDPFAWMERVADG